MKTLKRPMIDTLLQVITYWVNDNEYGQDQEQILYR